MHDGDRRDALFRSRRRLLIGTAVAAECFFLYRIADGGVGAIIVAMLPFLLALAIAAGPIELANHRLEARALDRIATEAGFEFERDTMTGRLHREWPSLLFSNASEKVARGLSADVERAFAGLESVARIVGKKRKADARSGRPPFVSLGAVSPQR
ncbi:hypothetical protein C7I55_14600 [Sphingomonas deserti]|uniref:Uncharacterized protein n=1 Tax=Allosphingosinicella deserti TaxID=2116704 RepID=A0A2P7QPB6_9SPHN|nr:hypothetical protein C7I55_14600 [Sphingomonas deserti]